MKIHYLLPLGLLLACGGEEQSTETDSTEEEVVEVETQEETSIELPPIDLSKDYQADIFMPGNYHGEEVPEDMEDKEWWGVFNTGGKTCVLEPANLTVESVHDAMMDSEGEQSGKSVGAENEGDLILLISGLDFLFEHEFGDGTIGNPRIEGGSQRMFAREGAQYRFISKADIDENGYVTNYHLTYEMTKDEETVAQEIAFIEGFDDAVPTVLFIGDIDGDGIADLLIDLSYKYSFSQPTLFLSRPAAEGDLVKQVGSYTWFGC